MKKLLLPLFTLISAAAFSQGGETCASATIIASLPYSNTGNTSTAADDYFTVCSDAGNNGGAKDRVYKYTTGATAEYIDLSLCIAVTNYDSQLYVYESSCTGTPYACQEDGCQSPAYASPYNSTITNLMLNPSTTYYIVVDGFDGSSNGAYQLNVSVGAGAVTAAIPFTDGNSLLPTSVFHSGNAVGVADMNNDGLDDIIRAQGNTQMYIDFQQTVGNFTETAYSNSFGDPWGMCVGDVNNDGYNDVLYGDYYYTYILTSSTAATFTTTNASTASGAGSIFVQGANFFDINNDGDLDAFVCDDVAMGHIYVGDGTGSWTFDQSLIPLATVPASDNSGNYASIWSDINNDDKQDFFITHCRQAVTSATDPRRIDQVFFNNGDNTFTQDVTNFSGLRLGAQGWSTTFADFDNDGDMDAFILQYDVNSSLLRNNGSGVFTDVITSSGISSTTSFFGMNVVSADFNNDGFIDIFLSGNEHHMYINNGDFTFTHDGNGMVYGTNVILAQGLGDLNHDGKIDMYASYGDVYNNPSVRDDKLWLNNVSNSNHYLSIHLSGVASNKIGIGAKVKIFGPWGVQVREIRSGEGYGIQNSFNAHFGLGANTTVDSIIVVWPSGTIDNLLNVAADQQINVVEGSSPVSVKNIVSDIKMQVYPNPTNGTFTLDLGTSTNATVAIKDMSGRVVKTATGSNRYYNFDINTFANGVYTYEVITTAGKFSGKVMKQ